MSAPPIIFPNLAHAQADLRERVSLVLDDLRCGGYLPRLHEVIRSRERGEWLMAHDRSQLGSRSLHCRGMAADIVCGRVIGGLQVWWGASTPEMSDAIKLARAEAAGAFFGALGIAAKDRGLVWGGDWSGLYDPAHVQVGG